MSGGHSRKNYDADDNDEDDDDHNHDHDENADDDSILETARLEVATGKMSELIPAAFHTRWPEKCVHNMRASLYPESCSTSS